MKKAIVFGGAGFLGSHVADKLSEKGYKVTVSDMVESEFLSEDQSFIKGDITDLKFVTESIKGFDLVYHFAGLAGLEEAKVNPVRTMQINLIGTANVLEACKIHKVERIIFSSSVYVYSDLGSFYRVSKQACEKLIEEYSKEYGLDYTILRFGSLYGPRANEFNSINQVLKTAIETGKITRSGNGDDVREYIYVIDAASLCVDVLDDEYINKHVIITGPRSMKVKELFEIIKEIIGDHLEVSFNGEIQDKNSHYKVTPYNYRPKVAMKLSPRHYHDLGQGLLEVCHSIGESNEGSN